MWSYYGSKTNIIHKYPAPMYDKIIEPFAGSARYALRYFDRDVLLVDKYEVVVRIWKWLQQCSVSDIQWLPRSVEPGKPLDEYSFDCEEAKFLMGFLVGFGMERPRRTASIKRTTERPNHINYSLNRIANNLFKIKHWKIEHGSYENVKNQKATWFIDPPYQAGGHAYVESNKNINYDSLANWCTNRYGQVIVCESSDAKWLDFKPLAEHRGSKGNQKEVVWSNYHVPYQMSLFTPSNY